MKREVAAIAIATALLTIPAAVPASAMECVAYAKSITQINLRGDAWKWWDSANGEYSRGHVPHMGAVMVFDRTKHMRHGHVAVVREIINSRKMLVDHANWAPQRGHGRGQVTTRVMVLDVSPHNDWTQVRVWHEASGEMGQRVYPTYGFIYTKGGNKPEDVKQAAAPAAEPEIDFATDMIQGSPLGMPSLPIPLATATLLPAEPAYAQ